MEEESRLFPLLCDVKSEFLYGYSSANTWRRRSNSDYHKISASPEWYAYKKRLLTYPSLLTYDNVKWQISEIGCGKRGKGDYLLLVRSITIKEILLERNIDSLEQLRTTWHPRHAYAQDEEGDYYKVEKLPIHYFVENWSSNFDRTFYNWHKDCQINAFITQERKESEVKEMSCKKDCRPSYCYCKNDCDDKNLSYEINEHSMEVEVTVGFRSFSLTLDESAELASFLLSAKDKIKEKKIAALEQQQEELKKQLENVKSL